MKVVLIKINHFKLKTRRQIFPLKLKTTYLFHKKYVCSKEKSCIKLAEVQNAIYS